jgi:hypothetical protein
MGKAQGKEGREKCAKGFSGETCKKGASLKYENGPYGKNMGCALDICFGMETRGWVL